MMQQRKVWIDWAKVLGMLAIIYGHCFPEGMSNFIYAFNVPVFFLISGYLCRGEDSFGICRNKILHNLLIPYLILAFIKAAGPIFKHIGDGEWIWSVLAILGGFHSLNNAPGCSNLWFVYTLIIIKIVYQLANKRVNFLLVLFCFLGAWVYNDVLHLEWQWAMSNCLLAYPFFWLGNILAQRGLIDSVCAFMTRRKGKSLLLVFFLFVVTYWISNLNGQVKMYMNLYADNILLFVLAALLGCGAVLGLTFLLNEKKYKFAKVISSGTILILVFHRELLHPLLKAIGKCTFDVWTSGILVFFECGACSCGILSAHFNS